MFYKPKFCCNCGEKIERVDWTPMTSRRFCEYCAIEKKPYDLAPKAIILIAIAFGLYGFGGSLQREKTESDGPRIQSRVVSKPARNLVSDLSRKNFEANTQGQSGPGFQMPVDAKNAMPAGSALANAEPVKKLRNYEVSSDEPAYFCGAMTKKGTPCSRRVKTKGRCWQHSRSLSSIASSEND